MKKTAHKLRFEEKGIAHLTPLLAAGLLIFGLIAVSSYQGNNSQKKEYTRLGVLSESDDDDDSSGSGSSGSDEEDDSSGSGSSGSDDDDSSGSGSSGSDDDDDSSGSGSSGSDDDDSSGSGSSGSDEEDNSGPGSSDDKDEDDSSGPGSGDRVETEVRYPSGVRVRTREEEGRRRVDIYEGGKKLRIETRDGVTTVSVENEDEEEIEEVELSEDSGVEVQATGGARLEIRSRNRRILLRQGLVEAQTDFPVSVDQDTGELTITTPAGERVVSTLPQQAIDNMLAQNVIDRILTSVPPTDVASPSPEATDEAALAESQSIELTEENGEVVYLVEGAREERLLGLFNVLVPKTAVVSADTGDLLEIRQPVISRILDLLAF